MFGQELWLGFAEGTRMRRSARSALAQLSDHQAANCGTANDQPEGAEELSPTLNPTESVRHQYYQ